MTWTHPSRCVLWIAALAVLGSSFGCRTVNTVEREDPIGQPNYVDDKRITTSGGLERKARVLQVREAVVSGDLLKVEADLRNTTSNTERIAYRFEWFDDQGMMVADTPGWRQQALMGGETVTVSAVAPTPRAVNFRLKMRENRY